jgi:hypothetical protein
VHLTFINGGDPGPLDFISVSYGNFNKLQKDYHVIIFGYSACGWALRKSE